MGNNSSEMAAPFVVNATAKHTATVIFLHGLGDTGHGWSQAFSVIRQPHVKYICPNAAPSPVTLNAGFIMPSWFDIRGLDPNSEQDEPGILSSSEKLQGLIADEESKGIPRNRIVVGGFSQGGAVALYSALSVDKSALAGVLGLSTWLPLHKTFPGRLKSNQNTPILQCHGQADPLVNIGFGSMTAQLLKSFNPNHQFKTYPNLEHSSSDDEMQDVKKFLIEVLPTQ